MLIFYFDMFYIAVFVPPLSIEDQIEVVSTKVKVSKATNTAST